jgi:hypothetical protein
MRVHDVDHEFGVSLELATREPRRHRRGLEQRKRTRNRRNRLSYYAISAFFWVVGWAISGLLGVIIINLIWPGHPFYVYVETFLHAIFGA